MSFSSTKVATSGRQKERAKAAVTKLLRNQYFGASESRDGAHCLAADSVDHRSMDQNVCANQVFGFTSPVGISEKGIRTPKRERVTTERNCQFQKRKRESSQSSQSSFSCERR